VGRANHVTGGVGSNVGQHTREEVLERLCAAWDARIANHEAEEEAGEAAIGKIVRFGDGLPPDSNLEQDGGVRNEAMEADSRQRHLRKLSSDSDEAAAEKRALDHEKEVEREKLRKLLLDLLESQGLADLDLLRACDRNLSTNEQGISRKEWLRCLKRIFVPNKKQLLDHAAFAANPTSAADTMAAAEVADTDAMEVGLEHARRALMAQQAADEARKEAEAAADVRMKAAIERWDHIRPAALWGFEYCMLICCCSCQLSRSQNNVEALPLP